MQLKPWHNSDGLTRRRRPLLLACGLQLDLLSRESARASMGMRRMRRQSWTAYAYIHACNELHMTPCNVRPLVLEAHECYQSMSCSRACGVMHDIKRQHSRRGLECLYRHTATSAPITF